MYAAIAIDVPLRTLFTYKVPDSLKDRIKIGQRVLVSFRKKKMIGFCLETYTDISDELVKATKLKKADIKEIENVIDDTAFGVEQRLVLHSRYLEWLKFAADYYYANPGVVLSQAVPPYYFDVKKLAATKEPKSRETGFDPDLDSSQKITLTATQSEIAATIEKNADEFYPSLIHGVTGSGKTEIYIKLIEATLAKNKSVLFLVPEIGLTPQMMARLSRHFRENMLVYHSALSPNQRLGQWRACLETSPRVMLGTRSALFAPFENLGLIIIDEEQDSSYKQDDRFRYHARDLAVMRAKIHSIPIVMGSATPSLEAYFLARSGRYHYFELKERIGEAKLPQVRVIDFNKERAQTGTNLVVSQSIHDAIEVFYQKRQQMMIFCGQRAFAQNAFCTRCQSVAACPNCSVGLKFHKRGRELKCHYCDYAAPFDEICPSCQHLDKGDVKTKTLTLLGFGTQSVEEEIKALHPKLVIERLDSDSVTPKSFAEILNRFAKGEINLLIGTQMIAKGHDFGNVGFVGVLGVDVGLGLPDFRAAERAFQTIVQVAGRSGRALVKGHVMVQSLMPEQTTLKLALEQDYKKFAALELKSRETALYPPFVRLIEIRFSSAHESVLTGFFNRWSGFLNKLRDGLRKEGGLLLGPTEMPIAKLRGKHRYHLLFKIKRGVKMSELLDYVVASLDKMDLKGIAYQIDVDPVGLV